MPREFTKKSSKVFEDIMMESLKIISIEMEENKAKLLLRLILSGIAKYYFLNPDDVVDLGFLRFGKNPTKEELFKVEILKSEKDGVVNADTMWKFYTGELQQEKKCKELLDKFLTELIDYSQEQEINIMKLTKDIERKKGGK